MSHLSLPSASYVKKRLVATHNSKSFSQHLVDYLVNAGVVCLLSFLISNGTGIGILFVIAFSAGPLLILFLGVGLLCIATLVYESVALSSAIRWRLKKRIIKPRLTRWVIFTVLVAVPILPAIIL